MSFVFVVDADQRPLVPCHPARARRLLDQGKAAVWRHYPFTIILKHPVPSLPDDQPTPLQIKLDPSSKTTGIAVIQPATGQVVWAAELTHRGQSVHLALLARRALRRSRRQRHTRYRPARFANRRKPAGWLPPSLESRLANILTWVARLRKVAPIGAIAQELVRFDMQLLERPDINSVEYQQGTLAGYEVREYLLEKWERRCVYCGAAEVPLQIEHIVPKARGGTSRISNLTLACEVCNQAKGTQTATEFGHPAVQAQARLPLKDAAAVNASRWALYRRLQETRLPVEASSGDRTKWNRTQRGLPKAHWIDAACVGASTPSLLQLTGVVPLAITVTGHGTRQMCGTDRYGFPTRHRTRQKRHFGFATGDMARAVVPAGLKTAGRHVGRVLVRANGSFDLVTSTKRVAGISYRYCQMVAQRDGYAYQMGAALPPLPEGASAPQER